MSKEIELADKVLSSEATAQRDEQIAFLPTGAEVMLIAQLAPLLIGAVAKTATGLASLFRRNVTITNFSVTIGDTALISAVCGELALENVCVYHPAQMLPPVSEEASALSKQLAELSHLRFEIDTRLDALSAVKNEKPDADKPQVPDTKEETKVVAKTAKPDSRRARAAEAHARLTSIAKAMDELRASLAKMDDEGATPLAELLRAEAFATIVEGAHVLQLKVETAGGAANIKEGEVRSKGARFSGGVVVQFVLFDPSSRILDAGTLSAYSGLRVSDETAEKINLIEAVTDVDRRQLRPRR